MTNRPNPLMDDNEVTKSRRSFLANGVRLSLAATFVNATAAGATLCIDPEELSSADYQFRKYVEYTESYSDPDKTCSKCAFFKPGPNGSACGSCQVVASSISAQGHCKSWEARPAEKDLQKK